MGASLDNDNLPDELIVFLKGDRILKYDPSECEIGLFSFHSLQDVRPIQIRLSTLGQDCADDDPYDGRGHYVTEGFDLIKTCEHYDPAGVLVYVPLLKAFGSYDCEHLTLVVYPGISWSQFSADPVRYINAAWGSDPQFAKPANPIGVFRHVGFTNSPGITRIGDDYVEVTCQSCERKVRSVEILFDHHDRYWVCYECECGHTQCITDIEGDMIPEALRTGADIRHHAVQIKSEIDEQRRSLPQSAGKTSLRKAGLDIPVKHLSGDWLVYESPGEWQVIYSESSREYTLTFRKGQQRTFGNVMNLSTFLGGR